MTHLLQTFNEMSNKLTMYKGVLYGLLSLLVVADVLAFLDVIGINPVGLIISVLVLGASCYIANQGLAKVFGAATNSESWLITALILACILNPRVSWSFVGLAALCGVIAMASKYVFTWRQSHIFNPAAFGAFIVSVTGLMSVNWWVATPWLAPISVVLALLVLRKQRKFTVFLVFAITAIVVMVLMSMGNDQAITEVIKDTILSWPLIFLGSVMLTEPTTLPSDKYYQLIIAVVVGALFCIQMHAGPISSAPHTVLLVGNLLALCLAAPFGAWLRLKNIQQLAPDIYELTFNKPRGLKFRAGQYMEWTLPHANTDIRGNRRTFSIASAPAENNVRLAIRTYPNGSSYKKALIALKPGDTIRIANISGEFTLPASNEKLLFIAGGIGITPFRSMIAQLAAAKKQCDVRLVYFANSKDQFVFTDVLQQAEQYGIQTHYSIKDGEIENLVPDFSERHVYISGSHGMVEFYRKKLRKLGVKHSHIHTDHFSGY